MIDYLNIGSTPTGEDCAQVGTEDYQRISRIECNAFINQLRRELGNEPHGAFLISKSFPHDFGSYMEVICKYDDTDEEAIAYAFRAESEQPEYWDEEAKKELKEKGIKI